MLPSLPSNILRRVALFAIGDDVPGPPTDLYAMLLTCKSLQSKLDTQGFHYDVLNSKFEIHSALRRLGESTLKEEAKIELRRRFTMLKSMRSDALPGNSITEALWMAFTMLEDIRSGSKSLRQLTWARLPDFLDGYLRGKLYEGAELNEGWPLLNEANSLAIALSWLCLGQGSSSTESFLRAYVKLAKVNQEEESTRKEILRLLEPFVFAAFRYPIFGANECFLDSHKNTETSSQTTHGSYPPDPLPQSRITYFGNVACKAHAPVAPLYAAMMYFTRLERVAPMIPPHLTNAPYRTREEANEQGYQGPTLEDIMDFVDNCHTGFMQAGYCRNGLQHITLSIDLDEHSPYALGLLTGRWRGSYILPFVDDYQSWLHSSSLPVGFKATGRLPLFLTLREHYTCERENVLPRDDEENGTLHAWLPQGCRWEQKNDGIEIFDDDGTFKKFYRTYRQGEDSSNIDAADVIITGETDDRHAAAWGAYSVIGRIRLDDGLIMLERRSLNDYGTTLMRGYVTPCNNFVGRLRGASTGIAPAGWEGVFILCKS